MGDKQKSVIEGEQLAAGGNESIASVPPSHQHAERIEKIWTQTLLRGGLGGRRGGWLRGWRLSVEISAEWACWLTQQCSLNETSRYLAPDLRSLLRGFTLAKLLNNLDRTLRGQVLVIRIVANRASNLHHWGIATSTETFRLHEMEKTIIRGLCHNPIRINQHGRKAYEIFRREFCLKNDAHRRRRRPDAS